MFTKSIHVRIKILSLVICMAFLLVIIKVFYIQVIDYNKLNKYATDLLNRNLPIEGNRGIIYDSTFKILASNVTTTSLIVIPNQIVNKEEVALKLSDILKVSYEEMYKHISKKTSMERVHPEGRRLDYAVANKISSLNYDGVYLIKETKRYYPYGSMLSQSIGFTGIDNQGLSGLELTYNDYLTGEYGAIKYFSDAKGNKLSLNEIYVEPQDGMNVVLTINYDIQTSLERELNNAVSRYNPDQAIGIVMNPNNGEILAISSRPNFNPTNYKDYDMETINRNLPIWATFEPGSTFKIITLAAAVEEKLVDLYQDTFYDKGSISVENTKIKCWKKGGHGLQTYMEVVQNSCNPGFVRLGQKLGVDKLFGYIESLGFGKKTGIDLIGESDGIIFDIEDVGPVELATTAFGQGVSVTPIQQITAVSAIINGGILYKPYIVKSLNEPETNSVIENHDSVMIRKVISEDTSIKVRDALERVVAYGTGRNAYIDGYRVGGKTGTAQKVKNGRYMIGNYIVSFIGFLPASNPEVIIYIAVDNPKGVTQYGGTISAPIARNVLMDTIKALNIERADGGLTKKYNYLDKKYALVPDVTGMNTKEAIKLLKKFKVEFSGNGNTVLYQVPKGNTSIYEGESVKLYLAQ